MYPSIENITITLNFSVYYTSVPPILEIKNNDRVIFPKTSMTESGTVTVDIALPNNLVQPGKFEVYRSNFDGVTEQYLTLDQLYLDNINLKKICYQSKYYPIYPEPWRSEQELAGKPWPEYLTGVTSWGWNGRWVIEYETPIYTWLLKNV
jgi:hypothetical protein